MAHRVNSVHSTQSVQQAVSSQIFFFILAKSLTLTSHRFLVYATNIPLSSFTRKKTSKNRRKNTNRVQPLKQVLYTPFTLSQTYTHENNNHPMGLSFSSKLAVYQISVQNTILSLMFLIRCFFYPTTYSSANVTIFYLIQ